jgi:hypothetical protein
MKETKRMKDRRDLRRGRFCFREKKDVRVVDPDEHPQGTDCRGS